MFLSLHFTLEEAIKSDTATRMNLNNMPGGEVAVTMKHTALEMEFIRRILGDNPIKINSWYRSAPVNKAVGSSDRSQHRLGEAVDFKCPAFGTPLDICRAIIAYKHLIPFDQLILEHSWVHISFAILSGKPRGQVISLLASNKYAAGLTNPQGIPYK